eukprot:TRINITY_DN1569_c6_g1_i2.p1 TRINITY_DN1569_c6_g1~~TRINITY_DN1569_c6_g1_i2.p1  ORF type:complete len:101 (+),score=36.18 TRINITY_DN1569_c6_g1_i2:313-615(+)
MPTIPSPALPSSYIASFPSSSSSPVIGHQQNEFKPVQKFEDPEKQLNDELRDKLFEAELELFKAKCREQDAKLAMEASIIKFDNLKKLMEDLSKLPNAVT